jgi:hypothetical protein
MSGSLGALAERATATTRWSRSFTLMAHRNGPFDNTPMGRAHEGIWRGGETPAMPLDVQVKPAKPE